MKAGFATVLLVSFAAAQVVAVSLAAEPADPRQESPMKLWYDRPAKAWTEALPVGNGRLGSMIFGGTADERLQFNEHTLWTGKPHEYQHPGAVNHLPAIRKLLAEGKQHEAEALAMKEFMSLPLRQTEYQPFGDLRLHFPGHEAAADYRRELDIDSAIASVTYRVGDVRFERQAFASLPDQVLVVRLRASQAGSLSFTAKIDSPHKGFQARVVNGDQLALSGQVQADGLKFEARLRAVAEGGKVTVQDGEITVENADAVTLLLVAATSFKSFRDISGDPAARCEAAMKAVAGKTFDAIRKAHVEDHQRLFRRVAIDLTNPTSSFVGDLIPTDQRLARVRQGGADPGLEALYFQYGRYLLIASSRPGGQPANLQGLWNDQLRPPWGSKYTTNINCEMNYWPAEVANLSECAEPLFGLIEDCAVTGRKVAEAHYRCRGWVLHHNTDLWRGTAPINASNHGIWVTGGAWLCHHLWDHYLFTGDRDFLARRAYPAMKEAAVFFTEFLVKDPRTGGLISTPSNSPEIGGLVAGPTMDHQIIRDLFANTAEAAKILGVDPDFAAKLTEMRPQIAPNQIGKHGQLQEWLEDKDNPKETHRHVSHTWGLYPGWEITPSTPKLFAAAKQSLIFRTDGGTGWSKAWKINLWARLLDGDHAHKLLCEALAGNTAPNLFDLHPPFQIDGNFGGTSGVAEMLLQSHLRSGDRGQGFEIHLLPALPQAWPTGSIRGLCARGGFLVDLAWRDGKLTEATLRSKLGRPAKVRYGDKAIDLQTEPGGTYRLNGTLLRM